MANSHRKLTLFTIKSEASFGIWYIVYCLNSFDEESCVAGDGEEVMRQRRRL
jgi:hypothetical protein